MVDGTDTLNVMFARGRVTRAMGVVTRIMGLSMKDPGRTDLGDRLRAALDEYAASLEALQRLVPEEFK